MQGQKNLNPVLPGSGFFLRLRLLGSRTGGSAGGQGPERHDLAPHAGYVLNLRWDVLVYNAAADDLFGFARAAQEADIQALVHDLLKVSPEFKQWWREHDVHAPCNGRRYLQVDDRRIGYEHTSLTVDADRHLRLVVYARALEE